MRKNNVFQIIFQTPKKEKIKLDYILNDTLLAEKWFKKIKHLKNISIDKIESGLEDVSDLHGIYKLFCDYADLQPIKIKDHVDQSDCNRLHQIFESNHEHLSRRKDNSILYRFHHAIHKAEETKKQKNEIFVGWGVKEGPLTEKFKCYDYYEKNIKQNNIYLPWAELGKTPYTFWTDGETGDIDRFVALCRPHTTLRAKFFIAVRDAEPMIFPNQFNEYFNNFKQAWFKKHSISEWTEKNEFSAPLLAYTRSKIDITGCLVKQIVL